MFTETALQKFKKTDLINMILLIQSGKSLSSLPTENGIEIIHDFSWNGRLAQKIIKINGKKFKIEYDNRNGSPLGFDYRFSSSVMDDNGTWKYVAETKEINYMPCSYVCDEDKRKQDAINFIDAMQKHLEKIYS